jgi:hypothetical protein
MKFVCTECDEPMKFDQNGAWMRMVPCPPPSAAPVVNGV